MIERLLHVRIDFDVQTTRTEETLRQAIADKFKIAPEEISIYPAAAAGLVDE